MKFHRVLLFTKIQMEVTPVGDDLLILLTGGDNISLDCTAYATPSEDTDAEGNTACDIAVMTGLDDPESTFCIYVADKICKATGKNVICTGGIYCNNLSDHEMDKLYENVDDLIKDWVFFNAD